LQLCHVSGVVFGLLACIDVDSHLPPAGFVEQPSVGPVAAPMANSSALDSCVKQSYRKKIVRAAVRVRAVHRTRHHLSVPALSSDLISADKALRAPRTAALSALKILLHRLRITSRQSTSPECVGWRASRHAGKTCVLDIGTKKTDAWHLAAANRSSALPATFGNGNSDDAALCEHRNRRRLVCALPFYSETSSTGQAQDIPIATVLRN
jgi:hypothetical protein